MRESVRRPDYEAAIRKYYFSAKRNSLRTAYELYILENYTNKGVLADEIPSWSSFRLYYFRHFRGDPQKEIAREGLTAYQRNNRPLYGSAMQYRESVGCYQVDETQGDIYLVSKWDRSKVIGRPNVYLAIDTASGHYAWSSRNSDLKFRTVTRQFTDQHPTLYQTDQTMVPITATPDPDYPLLWHFTADYPAVAAHRILTIIQVVDEDEQPRGVQLLG